MALKFGGVSNLREVRRPAVLGPEDECAGEDQQQL
jgi:hypothetical protein